MKDISAAIKTDNGFRMQLDMGVPETSELFTGNTRILYNQKRLRCEAEEKKIKKRIESEKERFKKESAQDRYMYIQLKSSFTKRAIRIINKKKHGRKSNSIN